MSIVVAVVRPPVSLQLAQPAREIPTSRPDRTWAFEPKFDGWRAVLFADAGMLQSRRDTDLSGRFPEIIDAATQVGDAVLDGEVVALRDGRLDFGALTSTPRARARSGVSIYFVAFDLLARSASDVRSEPYHARRSRLELLFDGVAPPLQLIPTTTDRQVALTWMRPEASVVGIEGVVAKLLDAPYRAGRGGAWLKIRQLTVVDAVVVGVTGDPERPAEVVLARRDDAGHLRQIGLSLPLSSGLSQQIGQLVTPTGEPPLPVSTGVFGRGQTQFRPALPELVVEVEVEASVESFANRLRPRVHRVRLDLDPDDLDA